MKENDKFTSFPCNKKSKFFESYIKKFFSFIKVFTNLGVIKHLIILKKFINFKVIFYLNGNYKNFNYVLNK